MGFHIAWLAVRGKSPTTVRHELRLEETGEHCLYPESGVASVELPSGWYLVHFNDPAPPELNDEVMAKLSVGAEVVTCVIEEAAMVSIASGFRIGTREWSIVHYSEQGLEHLESTGRLPEGYEAIRDRLLAELKADTKSKHTKYGPCDYLFDVPAEVVKEITGYRHDEIREDDKHPSFSTLTRASTAGLLSATSASLVVPKDGVKSKPWWKVW